MNFFPGIGLSEIIVQFLRDGPLKIAGLKIKLKNANHSFTEQGMYKSLRSLRNNDIIIIKNSLVMLNSYWLQQLDSFVSIAQHSNVSSTIGVGTILQMQSGDSIIYSFKNPVQVDTFWNHALYTLFEVLPTITRWYAYSSHHWFLLCRQKEELALMSFMKKRGIRYLFTSGHTLPLDLVVRTYFDGVMSQYAMLETPLFQKRGNHLGIVLNILGDYIIEAQYDKHTTERIEEFYQTYVTVEKESIQKLEETVTRSAKIKFTVTKNSFKAQKLSRSFEKYFYFGKK